jgi:hypothetical protein
VDQVVASLCVKVLESAQVIVNSIFIFLLMGETENLLATLKSFIGTIAPVAEHTADASR